MTRWHFEAVDLRAGLAIAVRRPPRTAANELVCSENPCLFFSPPYFQPEAIGNLTIAMAASRGSLSAGLYVGNAEVSFATPEEIAEFVRRAYVGGAGGDGADSGGGGGGPVPVPPQAPDDVEPIRIEEIDARGRLMEQIDHFSRTVDGTDDGESTPFEWQELLHDSSYEAMHLMVQGVLALYRELLRRMPDEQSDSLRWIDDMRALSQAVLRARLLPVLLSMPYITHFRTVLEHSNVYRYDRKDGSAERFLTMVDLFFGPERIDDEFLKTAYPLPRRFRYRDLHDWALVAYASPPAWNILDVLERLPLPASIQATVPPDLGPAGSVYHLLTTFVSDPRLAMATGCESTVLGISLFAAACICTASAPVMQETILQLRYIYRGYPERMEPLSNVARHRAGTVTDHALAWLEEHLPRLAYSPLYESLIATAKKERYRLPGDARPALSTI
jgi:hypothetical protein